MTRRKNRASNHARSGKSCDEFCGDQASQSRKLTRLNRLVKKSEEERNESN
jgi:hypothetical protein